MQPEQRTAADEEDESLNDFERGFIAAVLFIHGVKEHPSFEEFRDAMHVMEAYSIAGATSPPARH